MHFLPYSEAEHKPQNKNAIIQKVIKRNKIRRKKRQLHGQRVCVCVCVYVCAHCVSRSKAMTGDLWTLINTHHIPLTQIASLYHTSQVLHLVKDMRSQCHAIIKCGGGERRRIL